MSSKSNLLENEDELDDAFPSMDMGDVDDLLGEGYRRAEKLRKLLSERRDGRFVIPFAHDGYESGFESQANVRYLRKTYKWLHAFDSCAGIDVDDATNDYGSLDRFLEEIPEDEWSNFIYDIKELKNYGCLDQDAADALRIEAENEWVKSDGVSDARKSLRALAQDSFDAFVLQYVSVSMVWEYMNYSDVCLEDQGNGSVYADLTREIDDDDIPWFLEKFPNKNGLKKKWRRIKEDFYSKYGVHRILAEALRKVLAVSPELQEAYEKLTPDDLKQLFFQLAKDSNYKEPDSLSWQFNLESHSAADHDWACVDVLPDDFERGIRFSREEILRSLTRGITVEVQQFRTHQLIVKIARREPAEHPELPLGESAEDDAADPGDIDDSDFLSLADEAEGPISATQPYVDSKIRIYRPRTEASAARILTKATHGTASDFFCQHEALFLVTDLKTHDVIVGVGLGRNFTFFGPSGEHINLALITKESKYKANIVNGLTKCLTQFWINEQGADPQALDSAIAGLVRLKGVEFAVSLISKFGSEYGSDFNVLRAIDALNRRDVEYLAKILDEPKEHFTDKGVYCTWKSAESLSVLFRYESDAEDVLGFKLRGVRDFEVSEYDLKHVNRHLTDTAKKHLRDILINRKLWFPEAGRFGEGAYVVVKRDLLDQYTDDDLIKWVTDPAEEDLEELDDIHTALKYGLRDAMEDKYESELFDAYVDTVVDELTGKCDIERKKAAYWDAKDNYLTFVSYEKLKDFLDTWKDEYGYSGQFIRLSSLVMHCVRNLKMTEQVDYSLYFPTDRSKQLVSDQLMDIGERSEPEDPKQLRLPLPESEEDDGIDTSYWMDVPDWLESGVKAIVQDAADMEKITINGEVIVDQLFDEDAAYGRVDFWVAVTFEAQSEIYYRARHDVISEINYRLERLMRPRGFIVCSPISHLVNTVHFLSMKWPIVRQRKVQ